MKGISNDPALMLQLVVTGTHLSKKHGKTVSEIEKAGFSIDETVSMDLDDDAAAAVVRATGQCLSGMASALKRLQPDLLVLLGDRYEILATAFAALILRIPIAHIAGGEMTEGAMDEAIRHAVTKMAHLHFPAAEDYRRRIIQLGEDPARVRTVGAMALDNLEHLDLIDRQTLFKSLGIEPHSPILLITYHPVTLERSEPATGIAALLDALTDFPCHWFIFTGVNADPGNDIISRAIHEFAEDQKNRTIVTESLGQRRYLSAMKHTDAVVGNSSSGIVEAPALGVPTVNIGERQRGRLRAPLVLDCPEQSEAISATIKAAIEPEFREKNRGAAYPFGTAGATGRILDVIRDVPLDDLLMKRFHDIQIC